MKISKAIIQKAKDENEDPHLAMFACRTTPISPTTSGLMELTHGCKPRGDFTIVNAAMRTKGIVVKAVKSLKNQQKSDENHLIEGQDGMYKTLPEKIWKKANVIKYIEHQSYLIHADDGAVYRLQGFT